MEVKAILTYGSKIWLTTIILASLIAFIVTADLRNIREYNLWLLLVFIYFNLKITLLPSMITILIVFLGVKKNVVSGKIKRRIFSYLGLLAITYFVGIALFTTDIEVDKVTLTLWLPPIIVFVFCLFIYKIPSNSEKVLINASIHS